MGYIIIPVAKKYMDVLALLFPREKKFYRMVEKQVLLVETAVKDVNTLITSFEKLSSAKRKKLMAEITHKEQQDDQLYTEMVRALKSTFITPIDREDLHQLVSMFEMMMDTLEEVAFKVSIYDLKKIDYKLKEQTDLISQSFKKIKELIFSIRDESHVEKLCISIRKLEHQADEIYARALKSLFLDSQPPVTIIKMNDLYSSLEEVNDDIHEASMIIENIAVKYS